MNNDITFCDNGACPLAQECFRHIGYKLNSILGMYSVTTFEPVEEPEGVVCEWHYPLPEENYA